MVNKSVLNTASRFIKQISSEMDVKKAYLFGSYAKGLEKENSDIDIAIVIGNMHDFFATQMRLMKLRRKFDLRIEPHPIGEADFTNLNPFANQIQNTGIEIKLEQGSD